MAQIVASWIDKFRAEARPKVGVGTDVGRMVPDDLRPATDPKKVPVMGLTQAEFEEYDKIAARIGFAPGGRAVEEMRSLLSEMGVHIYDRAKVNEYLDKKYGAPRPRGNGTVIATWCWAPMRDKDQRKRTGGMSWEDLASVNGLVVSTQPVYKKAIPLPVLITVDRILQKFPETKFYVSNEYSVPPIPDPFLAILPQGGSSDHDLMIIERWDEPSFRG